MEKATASTPDKLSAVRRSPTPDLLGEALFSKADTLFVTEKEAYNYPLHLSSLPFDINPLSPTPLDVDRLQVYGQYTRYNEAAITYMTGLAVESAEAAGLSPTYSDALLNEILNQHNLRCAQNVKAFSRIKYYSPEDSSLGCLDQSSVEMIARVRAGIGYEDEPALILGAHPEMGGIEVMKDTDPIKSEAIALADLTYIGNLAHRASKFKLIRDFEIIPEEDPRSRVHLLETPKPVVVKKFIQAQMKVGDVPIQLVTRNSFLIVPDTDIQNPGDSVYYRGRDGQGYWLLGVDMTKYVRVDPTSDLYINQLQEADADTCSIPIWSKAALEAVQQAAMRPLDYLE